MYLLHSQISRIKYEEIIANNLGRFNVGVTLEYVSGSLLRKVHLFIRKKASNFFLFKPEEQGDDTHPEKRDYYPL